MTNDELELRIRQLVKQERAISIELLRLINEAERRELYLARGYPTLFEWLVKVWGYSHPAAFRRVQAARLLSAVPAAETEIVQGTLNLSNLAKAQSAIARQERQGVKVTNEAKEVLVENLVGKTTAEAESVVATAFPTKAPKIEKTQQLNSVETRLHLTLMNEEMTMLQRAKELLSHQIPGAKWGTVVAFLAKEFVRRKDPTAEHKKSAAAAHCNKSWPALRRQILQRDQGRCQYQDPKTGHTCHSRHQVEVDHIIPLALGGTNHPTNLRALCRAHNLAEARRLLGNHTMDRFLPSPD
jgi:hypothetical protein